MSESSSNFDDDGPPSVLVLHGLGGGPFELAPLIEALEAAGSRVSAPVLPGHEVLGAVMPASHWSDWIATAEASFDALAALGRPVVVIGFSTGGTLALLLATLRPVVRMVLLAPFLAIRFAGLIPIHPSTYLRPIARVWPDLPRRPAPIRDRQARDRLDSVARFQTFSLRATLNALELIERVKPLVPEIKTPTLILQGRLDSVVDPAGAVWLASHLGSSGHQLLYYSRSDHLLVLDHERDQVVARSVGFALGLEGRSSTGPR